MLIAIEAKIDVGGNMRLIELIKVKKTTRTNSKNDSINLSYFNTQMVYS